MSVNAVIMQQDFSSGGVADDFVAAPPGTGQFSSLSLQLQTTQAIDLLPELLANEQVVAAFDGSATAEIAAGKPSLTLRSAYRKYSSPSAADIGGFLWDGFPSHVTLLRQPLGTPAPQLL